ncbi:MAG: DUF3299 domain-containing protein [Verrucomicrobia bacterium]|nr:DUF3299 domain-containing protein [Verrucomicrobiota bacterium]
MKALFNPTHGPVSAAGAIAVAALMSGCGLGVQKSETIPAPVTRGEPIQKLEAAPAATVSGSNTAPAKLDLVAAATAAASGAEPVEMMGEFRIVGFDKLASYNYDIPDESPATRAAANVGEAPAAKDQIPDSVRALNGKKVALKGFMLPLKVEGGLITELLIMRDQSACCYGATPKINEWVSVKMSGKGVKPIMDVPVVLMGKLQVGEMRENGYLVGIYAMDGEKMTGPPEL